MAKAGRILLIHRGRYTNDYTYEPLDLVLYMGNTWLCKNTSLDVEPSEGSDNWQKFTEVPTAEDEFEIYIEGAMLDTYVSNGRVHVRLDRFASAECNFPVASKCGILTVESIKTEGQVKFVKQTYAARDNSGEYRRMYDVNTGEWSPWATYVTNDDILTVRGTTTVEIGGNTGKRITLNLESPGSKYVKIGSDIQCNSIHMLAAFGDSSKGNIIVRNFASGDQTATLSFSVTYIKADKLNEHIYQEMQPV